MSCNILNKHSQLRVINYTYICYFGSHTIFNYVPGGHPTPSETCFLFLDSITSNRLIHIFKIFMAVVDHPYALAQNYKYG